MTTKNGLTSAPNSISSSNGNTILPVARVKRILKEDDVTCGPDVSFLFVATAELFIEYLAKQGLEQAKKEGRKNLNYQDLANAVTRTSNLGFLKDVIPQTYTLESAMKLYEDAMKMRSELHAAMLTDNDETESNSDEDYIKNACDQSESDDRTDISEDDGSSIAENTPNGRNLHLNGYNHEAENGILSDSELSEAPETSSEIGSDTVVNDD
ncbi:9337_t:CDS:2 [Acaulospora morrowiae]|uniref:9337_t:CDS:1 n=1 Tax=Acaulospora morrowiae TaxID=94023 RepID=A0A9N9N838_9GLOM|nr:9337_t:CDS:2 [Acaulospora morrowiae]